MRQTGASDGKVEQAVRYLRHDFGYTAVGAYQVATDVIGIAVTTDERIIALDDLKQLRIGWGIPKRELSDEDRALLAQIDRLIAGDDQ